MSRILFIVLIFLTLAVLPSEAQKKPVVDKYPKPADMGKPPYYNVPALRRHRGERFYPPILQELPVGMIWNITACLEDARASRSKYPENAGYELMWMDRLALKLAQHHEELTADPKNIPEIYTQAIDALLRSFNERGIEDYSSFESFRNLNDARFQETWKAANEVYKSNKPRRDAQWRVRERLNDTKRGTYISSESEEFKEAVEEELARMIAVGEVAAPQPTGSEIPAPPRPEGWQQPIDPLTASAAKQAAGEVFSLRRWSGWQLGALATLIAASAWALWRRFARKI